MLAAKLETRTKSMDLSPAENPFPKLWALRSTPPGPTWLPFGACIRAKQFHHNNGVWLGLGFWCDIKEIKPVCWN